MKNKERKKKEQGAHLRTRQIAHDKGRDRKRAEDGR